VTWSNFVQNLTQIERTPAELLTVSLAFFERVGADFQSLLLREGSPNYTVNHKKREILFLTITSANLNRFLYFLHHFNHEEIPQSKILKFTTSP